MVTHSILFTLRKGFTYFLIYYYFFFSSVVCAGTHSRVWVQEPLGIEDQRGPSSHTKLIPLEEEKVSGTILPTFSTSKGLFTRLKDMMGDTLSTLTKTVKETVYGKIDNFSEWAYEGLKDLAPLLLAKSPQEAAFDKGFWQANFIATIEELQAISSPTPEDISYLEDIQSQVSHKLLSPYQYEMGLQELETAWPHQDLESIRTHFQTTLKNYPALLEEVWQSDLLTTLRAIHQSSTTPSELKGLLTYYRSLINPLDYKKTLVSLRSLVRSKKAVFFPHQHKEMISYLNEAIAKSNKQDRYALKVKRGLFNNQASELPFFKEEVHSQGIWADVEEESSLHESSPTHSTKPLSSQLMHKLFLTLRKGTNFVLQHPFQAATIILAGQVAAAAAMKAFSAPQSQPQGTKDSDETADNIKDLLALATENNEDLPVHDYGKRAIGDEFQINQNTTSSQPVFYPPAVVSLTNGNAFVIWEGDQSGTYDIYGRLFSPSGIALSNEFVINQNTAGSQRVPFAASVNGNAFVTWVGDQTGNYDIYGRIFFPNGTALNNEFVISQVTTGTQYWPPITNINGNAFVVWQGVQPGYGYGYEIYGRIFFPNGTALSGSIYINQITIGEQTQPSVAMLANGDAFVAWDGDQQAGNYDNYGRIFSANGIALSNEFQINQNTTGWQYSPSIASLTNGNAFVTWVGNQTGDWDTYGRLFSPNGTAISNDFTINQITTLDQYYPTIASLTNGNTFVTWEGTQTGTYDIYGRIFSPNGTALSNEFSINQITALAQINPFITAFNNSTAFVVWYGDQTGSYDIYGRIFTPTMIANLINPPVTTQALTTNAFTTYTPTTSNPTTLLPTSAPGTTGGSTTGNAGATTNQGTTASFTNGFTTASFSSPGQASSMSKGGGISVSVIAGVAGGVGGVICLTAGGFAAWKYFRHKQAYQGKSAFLELETHDTDPFDAVEGQGIYTGITLIRGQLNHGQYSLFRQVNEKLAKLIEDQTGIHVPPNAELPNLGKGSFGSLIIARNMDTKRVVADKIVTGEKEIETSLSEGRLQAKLSGTPHVMPLLDYIYYKPTNLNDPEDIPVLHQFMPLAGFGNGSFFQQKLAIFENQDLKERLLTHVAKDLLEGMANMHKAGIYHLDMKPSNLVIDWKGYVYVIDFGCAKELGKNDQIPPALGDKNYFSPDRLASVRYRWKQEGEQVQGEVAETFSAEAADAWAVGGTLLEIVLNKYPFESTVPFETKVTQWNNASFEKLLKGIPVLEKAPQESLLNVVKGLLAVNPKDRLTPQAALKKPVFKKKVFKEISEEEGLTLFKQLKDMLGERVMVESSYVGSTFYSSTQSKEKDENYHYDPHHKKPTSATYFTQ